MPTGGFTLSARSTAPTRTCLQICSHPAVTRQAQGPSVLCLSVHPTWLFLTALKLVQTSPTMQMLLSATPPPQLGYSSSPQQGTRASDSVTSSCVS